MPEFLTAEALVAFGQVILIDIALAADNAVVIALAASGLPPKQRRVAVAWGIGAATILRIAFATVTVQILNIVGLVLAGGILLLWVCWKMWAELHPDGVRAAFAAWRERRHAPEQPEELPISVDETAAQPKTLKQAVLQIVIADVSMSLDNVLAVAGAAREHPYALIFGLGLSIAMMGFAAMLIARLLQRHKWIAYAGLLIVFYVAVKMILEGSHQVMAMGIG
ncbi:TerC family protein [Frigidibacter sp. ROC022]|uniref:TerC family protein n=1 Tax=Frigidibacter sp. ROC022 TaxID=2971796 RepID=UPI00215A22A4|nr:TerC family protein [Frigidibacter sp. ROC022]